MDKETHPLTDLTAFQRDLLVVIGYEGPATGSHIGNAMAEVWGEESINPGRLYPNLATLEEEGLISKEKPNDRAHLNEITVEGREALYGYTKWASGHTPD